MRCEIDHDLDTFAPAALPWLEADPVRNNVLCTVIGSRWRGEAPVEAGALWVRIVQHTGELAGVAVRTPPHPLLVSALPPGGADALAGALAGTEIPGVTGPPESVRAFVSAWKARTGATGALDVAQRMYRLDAARRPVGVPGRLHAATEADQELVVEWTAAFFADAGMPAPELEESTRRRIAAGQVWFWRVDGTPVSMAGDGTPVAGVVRIGYVYTPPSLRRRGYAGACVAALSQLVLDRGADACMLYTDLANPTSNSVYQRIGYRPVADAETWTLTPDHE